MVVTLGLWVILRHSESVQSDSMSMIG